MHFCNATVVKDCPKSHGVCEVVELDSVRCQQVIVDLLELDQLELDLDLSVRDYGDEPIHPTDYTDEIEGQLMKSTYMWCPFSKNYVTVFMLMSFAPGVNGASVLPEHQIGIFEFIFNMFYYGVLLLILYQFVHFIMSIFELCTTRFLRIIDKGETFFYREYHAGKQFWEGEYKQARKFAAREYQQEKVYVKNQVQQYMFMQMLTSCVHGVGVIVGMFALFYRRSDSISGLMYQQGARQTFNRASIFLTGLLSLAMLILAPIMGSKKILEIIRPILDLLRQVPYASWVMDWLSKWWEGEVDFDDLPEDMSGLHEEFKDDSFKATQQELREHAERMQAHHQRWRDIDEKRRQSQEKLDEMLDQVEIDQVRAENNSRAGVGCDLNEGFDYKSFDKVEKVRKEIDKRQKNAEKDVEKFKKKFQQTFVSEKKKEVKIATDFNDKQFEQDLEDALRTSCVVEATIRDVDDEDKYLFESVNHIKYDGSKINNKHQTWENVNQTWEKVNQTKVDKSLNLEQQGLTEEEKQQKLYKSVAKYLSMKPEDVIRIMAQPLSEDSANERLIRQFVNQHENWFNNHSVDNDDYNFDRDYNGDLPPLIDEEFFRSRKENPWRTWLNDKWEDFKYCELENEYVISARDWFLENKETIGKCLIFAACFYAGYRRNLSNENYDDPPEDEYLEADKQGVNRGKKRGGAYKHVRNRKRPRGSGGEEDDLKGGIVLENPLTERELYYEKMRAERYDGNEFGYEGETYTFNHRMRDRRDLEQQGNVVDMPSLQDDTEIRRKIYAAKRRVVRANKKDVEAFISQARKKFESALVKCKKQSWNPNDKAAGVFKIYNDENRYLCTGTLVGNKMYVVMHVLSEDTTKNYTARNHVHSLELKGSKMYLMNDEIAAFDVNGIKSPFTCKNLKVLEDADIVTVFGFGSGGSTTPDSIVGFASPLGWCNAQTRCGDCTSPVLNKDGNIVGFWTNGNGVDFGRFEKITEEFIELAKKNLTANHVGLDFRSSPLFQKL